MTDIRRIHSGGPYETAYGYCRAVVAGDRVYVAGSCAQDGSTDVVDQCADALRVIGEALAEAGSGWDRVVRVRYYLPERADFARLQPLLAETFGDHPPAATMLTCGLITAEHRIEIEVDAVL